MAFTRTAYVILHLLKTHNALRLGGTLYSLTAILVCLVNQVAVCYEKKKTFLVFMAVQIIQILHKHVIEFQEIYPEEKHGCREFEGRT